LSPVLKPPQQEEEKEFEDVAKEAGEDVIIS